ncbi:MAG: hypothetical protein ACLQBX_10765 [Candidatus Limnocylindrales bacterium]|jgi:hypothetical protein
MERTDRPTPARGSPDAVGASGAPALRDAAAILARAEADEAAADQARERYRTQAMAALEPDPRIAPLLTSDERVFAVRRSAMLDRRQPLLGSDVASGLAGDLYVTSRRLVLVGRHTLSFDLADIEEAMLSGERLLFVLRHGQGASLDVDRPRLLRVEIAAARAAARG